MISFKGNNISKLRNRVILSEPKYFAIIKNVMEFFFSLKVLRKGLSTSKICEV